MTMCPICFKLYGDLTPKPCDICDSKTINVSTELIKAVKMLIIRGFRVVYANCNTYDGKKKEGKTTQIMIEFGDMYPEALFFGLPPDWMLYNYYSILSNQVSKERFNGLSCVYMHPDRECDEESIEFAIRLTISNMERWLGDRDVGGCRAVILLTGS